MRCRIARISSITSSPSSWNVSSSWLIIASKRLQRSHQGLERRAPEVCSLDEYARTCWHWQRWWQSPRRGRATDGGAAGGGGCPGFVTASRLAAQWVRVLALRARQSKIHVSFRSSFFFGKLSKLFEVR